MSNHDSQRQENRRKMRAINLTKNNYDVIDYFYIVKRTLTLLCVVQTQTVKNRKLQNDVQI